MDTPPVQYVTTSDGISIAYSVSGQGRPLVLLPQLFSHIEAYWSQQTFMQPWFMGLSSRFQLIQYDGRDQGMSSRAHEVEGMEDFVLDLRAVIEQVDLEPSVVVAADWHTHTAVRFAVQHPERVAGLVLISCSVDNKAWPMAIYETLAAQDWEAFLRSQVAAGQSADIPLALERLRQTVSQRDWLQFVRAAVGSDITDLLPRLRVPTLVLHPRNFFSLLPQESLRFAALIPNARVVLIGGAQGMGSASEGLKAIDQFVASLPPGPRPGQTAQATSTVSGLSQREVEVLRLLARGKSNQQIADDLVISLNTANRHVSNIYAKTGAANRAEAVSYAHRHGLAD